MILHKVLPRVFDQRSAMRQQYGIEPTMILVDRRTYEYLCEMDRIYAAGIKPYTSVIKYVDGNLSIYNIPVYIIDTPLAFYCECVLGILDGSNY